MTISKSACLSVISCNIWLSYWSPAPSTTTVPISEPHSKIVCMNKLLDKEQQRQWTWHDMTYLLSSIGHGFLPLQAALSLQEIPIPILGLLDSMDLTRSCPLWWFWHEQLFFTRYSSHTAQHSTAQQQLLIWNWSSQSLVMQNVKNVRRSIAKGEKWT